jgi:serine/threonine protein kinase
MNEKLIKKNSRSETYITDNGIKKIFCQDKCFSNNKMADFSFKKYPWFTPLKEIGSDYFLTEYYDENTRLDKVVKNMDRQARLKTAVDILEAILEMYIEGYSHRDLHSKNVFVKDGEIKIIDFEYLKDHDNVPFLESYDLVGRNLSSPYNACNMCYEKEDSWAIGKCLDIKLSEAIDGLKMRISAGMIDVSGDFKSKDGYHKRSQGALYGSFATNSFCILPERAQRNTEERLKKFGVGIKTISGQSVLDLGCNIGAVGFSIEKYKPKKYLGLEYKNDLVLMANKIAAVNGFTNYKFEQIDVDEMYQASKADTVFCLSLNKHVKNEDGLFELLGDSTNKTLYFEGNSGTDVEYVKNKLISVGFINVQYLGNCEDDVKSSNNNRPMFLAEK